MTARTVRHGLLWDVVVDGKKVGRSWPSRVEARRALKD